VDQVASTFEKLPAGELHALLKDKTKLAGILNYHATKGSLLAADIKQHFLPSIQGQSLQMAPSDTGFMVNDAKGSLREIEASNGVLHAIDTVLMPKA